LKQLSNESLLISRRSLLSLSGAISTSLASQKPAASSQTDMPLGLIIEINRDPEGAIAKVHDLGLPTCFLSTTVYDAALIAKVRQALDRFHIQATAVEALGPGKMVWDFLQGPSTIGLVPRDTRRSRIDSLKRASDFAATLGIRYLQTHCGFIPEDPNDPLYRETIEAVREVAVHCKGNQVTFLLETGQETPTTLKRAILDTGLDNIGVGLDTGNLILYGKANPLDALDVIGPYVRSVHVKDGLWPTDPAKLGKEVPVGKGRVDFPRVIARLRRLGYRGALTIEREISGPEQIEDIRKEKVYLEKIIAAVPTQKS
jgi:L-ribulose-5-phosphate 3-epimerase